MSEDLIHVISKSTIKVKSTARINLTPWDLELLFVEYSQKGLLFLKPTPLQESTIIGKTGTTSLIHHLKASLELTLHIFPPLAGRLATTRTDDGAASCFFIDCNHSEGGAIFIHATVNLAVADILDDSLTDHVPGIVHSLFPLTGVRNSDGVARPLLGVQVTELADGLFIGCSINHLLVDGTSFWHFFNSWAEISRGELIFIDNPISKQPFLNRDQVSLDLLGSRSINIYDEHLTLDNNPVAQSPRLLRDRVFHLTKESVAKLKAKANHEMVESKGKISSLQAVIAHVWRSIIRCRFDAMNSGTQETTFEIPMGARQRLMNPSLPEEYFGNAVFPGIVTLEAKKILENNLGWTAWQINRMVSSGNGPDKVKEFYMSWIKKPNFLRFDGLPSNHFILINSPRFNIYGNDFGWGKPVAVRGGRANSFDGRITISGGLEEGSVEIEACLLPETLSALAEDAEFMEFVTSKC